MPCRVCGTPGTTMCPSHTRTTTERGYGAAYQQARRQAIEQATHCTECGEPFTADNPATGGHAVALRDGGTLADGIKAQCRRCNYGWRRTGT